MGQMYLLTRSLSKLGFCPPTETGRLKPSLSYRLHFKDVAFRCLRKTFLSSRLGQRLGKDLHLKEAEGDFTVANFLK